MRVLALVALAAAVLLGVRSAASPEADVPAVANVSDSAGGGVAAPISPVFTIIDVNTYPVGGAGPDGILEQMRARGPKSEGRDFFGLTETQFAYRYWKNDGDRGCTLDQIRIDLNVTITLPQWDAPRDAPYELRRDWTRFESALRRHEDGHREIAEWGAREIYHALKNLKTASCATIDTAAQRTAERLREMSERRQSRYDSQTGHGRSQGAYWPHAGRRGVRP